MKNLLLILLLAWANLVHASIFYVSPTGSDSNIGSLTAPFKSVSFAATKAVMTGDIIHVLPGNYSESKSIILSLGVSIEGEGIASHISSTVAGDAISLVSFTDGGNGNQHISGIWLDGSNWTGYTGINVLARSNVKIFNCTVENFRNDGIKFIGSNSGGKPAVYMTGCELYNCILNNNSKRSTGQGSLVATGYRGMLIHDNIFDQTGRPAGNNGNTFSATTAGYSEGFKFYNNKSYRLSYEGTDATDGWGFHLEMWNSQGGQEVYNNEFYGGLQGIDWAGEENGTGIIPGTYAYAAYVHDNLFKINTPYSTAPSSPTSVIGTNIEGNIDGIIIANNRYVNYPYPIQATLINSTTYIKNITIRNNVFENSGYSGDSFDFDISLLTSNCPDVAHCKSITDVNIYNNTFKSPNVQSSIFVYCNNTTSKANNIQVINNIVQNAGGSWMEFMDAGVQSNYTIKNNLLYLNGNWNNILYSNGAKQPSGWTYTSNIVADPLLDASFKLKIGSPAINYGLNVGLPYSGAAPDCGAYEFAEGSSTINQAPVANAGGTQSITLPVNNVTLSGSGTDPDGTITAYSWSQISGPAASTISSASSASTTVTGMVQGTYQFQLKVTDNNGGTGIAVVQVIVNPAVSIPSTTTIDYINTSINVQKNAVVTWGAASASNTRRFELQRKSRYTSSYSTVSGGAFTAVTGFKEYSKITSLNTGTNYFRIKVSYTDRTPTYSSVFTITRP